MLNSIQIEKISKAGVVVFSTSNNKNKPRAIMVQPSKIETDKIIVCNIQMGKSFENLKENPNCFINVYIPEEDDLQYKIEGVAEIFNSGELFDKIKNFEENENGLSEYGLSVSDVIVVKINNVEESHG